MKKCTQCHVLKDEKKLSLALDKASISENESKIVALNSNIEDLKNEFRADAEKRAKLQMIIHKIADIENIKPTEEEIEKDVNQITAMYKDADPSRAKAYVEQMLENEKVLNFLEQQ